MKKSFFLLLSIIYACNLFSGVSYGGTYVLKHSLNQCENSAEYVEVGFFTVSEVNMDYYQIIKTQNNNWNNWTNVANSISSCGTCLLGNQYTKFDYGPFQPGEVWYYRVIGTSNLGFDFTKDLGIYTAPSAQSAPDWKYQVPNFVQVASTSNDPSVYNWHQETSIFQGLGISLLPTEKADLFLQQNSSKINFDLSPIDFMINIDVNIDNSGFFNLYSGTSISNYVWNSLGQLNSTTGLHGLQVRFTNFAGNVYYREYSVHVVPSSTELHKSNNCDVLRLYSNPSIVNAIPIIVSEGYDSRNSTTPEFYRYAGDALFSCLIDKGFKVYVINYKYNTQDIRNNAAIFSSAIKYVSSINGNQQVIAAGMSMGGIITRYALAKAENDLTPLPVSKFITMDAPHQGAIISKSLQDFKYDKQHSENNAAFLLHGLDNTAAKQLLINNVFENGKANGGDYSLPNNTHIAFYNELNSLNGNGYPHLTENIGVSFSDPLSHNTLGQTWLRIDAVSSAYSFNYKTISVEHEESDAGSYLPTSITNLDPVTRSIFWFINILAVTQPFNSLDVTFTRFLIQHLFHIIHL